MSTIIARNRVVANPGTIYMESLTPDQAWLFSDEARPILEKMAGVLAEEPVSPRLVQSWRKMLGTERTALSIELVQCRLRASEKFSAASAMFFTPRSLEQATDEAIARYKAARFPAELPVDDLCCGAGGDAIGLAARGPVRLVDLEVRTLACAAVNVRVTGGVATSHQADVAKWSLDPQTPWHCDPDRRPADKRTAQPEFSSPGQPILEQLLASSPHGALKLAPAAQLPAAWRSAMEQEWIESRGECRQLVAWSGVLAKHAGARTATLVARDGASHSFTADGTAELPQATSVESFVYDPAPSLRAARLVADWCHAQRLTALSAGSQFLTAAHGAASPLAQMFRVLDTLPFDIPRIKDWLRSRNIGRLEIKPREIGITPEKLRPQLQLRGNHAAVLLLYAHLGRPQALLAERCA